MQIVALQQSMNAAQQIAERPRRVSTAIPASAGEVKAVPQPGADFLIGRAAGVRQPVSTSYLEQEKLLFGTMTSWESRSSNSQPGSVTAIIGQRGRFNECLPNEWKSNLELLPGFLEAQAEQYRPQIIFSDSTSFRAAPWRSAIDASGTWIIQDLQRLREWADEQGASLVFFDQGDLPIGVNSAVIRKLFHVIVSSQDEEFGPEGSPIPAPLKELHHLGDLLSAQKRKA